MTNGVLLALATALVGVASAQQSASTERGDVLKRFYGENSGNAIRRIPSWIVPENAFAGIGLRQLSDPSDILQGRLAALFRDKSDWNVLTYCCRCVEHDNPAFAEKVSRMADLLKGSGIEFLVELDPRLMRDAFLSRHPEDFLRLRQFAVVNPDADGSARFEVKQELMSDYAHVDGTRKPYSGWRDGRLVSVRAAKGPSMRDVAVTDVVISKDVVSGVAHGIASNEVLLAEAEWPLKEIDPASPRLLDFSREMMQRYRALGVSGAMRDEYGFQKPTTKSFKSRLAYWHSPHFAKLYARRSGGRSLDSDLPILALGLHTQEAHVAAIAYTMSIYDACRATEEDFYNSTREYFGPDAYVAKHVTWHPPFSFEELLHNGLSWWASKRDWAQTDEITPVPVSTGMMKKFGTPLWLNEGYGRNPEHYVKTLWQYIACGGRMVYHGIFDWDMKNTSVGHYADPDDRAYYRHADLLNREGIRAEEISRLLPLMTRAPIDCPVAHIFGHDRLVDWLDSGYRDWGEPIAHGLGGLGYYADAYPASEIAEGTFSVCDDGMLRVGRQRYAACVLYHLSAREREAWDSLVGHRRLTTRAFVDPGVGEVADFLSSVGAVKQIPLGDTGLWGGRINRLPQSDGVMRLADGTSVRVKGGMPDLAGDAISGMLAVGGVNVKYEARGMFAARVENGELTGICGGEVRSVEAPGFSLNLDEPADIALVKLGGEWYGIWQTYDASRPIPDKLLAITTKLVKVLTCTSAAQID